MVELLHRLGASNLIKTFHVLSRCHYGGLYKRLDFSLCKLLGLINNFISQVFKQVYHTFFEIMCFLVVLISTDTTH